MLNERIQPDVELKTELVGEITYGPFANKYMKEIMRKFGKKAFGRSSACAEFEDFVASLVGGFGSSTLGSAKCCLEIGTFYGVTAVLLLQYFEKVVCVSVDLSADKDMKRRIVDHLGIKNIVFHDVKDNKEKAAVIRASYFDFCYQDGDHTNDTQTDYALVERCGRILFHEYWPLQPAVWNLVNSLPQDEVIRAKYDCLAYWEKKR